jgi:hypothetical protein
MGDVLRLRPDAFEWREIEGEIVAVDTRDSVYLAVNPSGTLLWPALARGATVDSLTQALVERYELAPEDAEEDVQTFVQTLKDRKLLDSNTS